MVCLFVFPPPVKPEVLRWRWLAERPAAGTASLQPRPPPEWRRLKEKSLRRKQTKKKKKKRQTKQVRYHRRRHTATGGCREQHGGGPESRSVITELSVTSRRSVSVCLRGNGMNQPGLRASWPTRPSVLTDPAGVSERSGRVMGPGGGGRSAESWKKDIVRQLKHRDLSQHAMFQDLIRFCTTHKYKFDLFWIIIDGLDSGHAQCVLNQVRYPGTGPVESETKLHLKIC